MFIKIIAFVLFAGCFNAFAQQQLIWIGEQEGENTINIDRTTFEQISTQLAMPIKVINANTARAFRLLSEKSQLSCRGNLIKTPEREATYAMTRLPQLVFPGLRLYSHTRLSDSDTIDLSTFKKPKLLLGKQESRNYGFDLVNMTYFELISVHASQRSSSVVKMFEKQRFDLLIEYPSVFSQYAGAEFAGEVYEYKITQAQSYNLGYIACTNSVEGQLLVKKIDNIISEISTTKAFLDAQTQWFKHTSITSFYNKVYKTDF